jgi:Zn-dependent peptidase ImmA (M78 family)/transcriptional regulator with XRE-family HTH domain
MIKNEYQYKIVKAQARNFEEALASTSGAGRMALSDGVHLDLLEAQNQGLKVQLKDLQVELREYEDLKAGRHLALEVDSLEALPEALVKARIASGMSQQDLAGKLGLKEQQIQRYEATNYASASMTRLIDVTKALGIKMRKDLLLHVPNKSVWPTVLRKLDQVGLPADFVLRRLIPSRLCDPTSAERVRDPEAAAFELVKRTARVFGWAASSVLGVDQLSVDRALAAGVQYKLPKRSDRDRVNAYTVYSHYLALYLIDAARMLPCKPIPETAEAFHHAVLAAYGTITLEHVLNYLWDLGVIVLPLNDPGVFHGACWRVDGRNVIVLKQRTRSLSRWLFDLLHEVGHVRKHPHEVNLTVIESPEDSEERRESQEERQASRFAGDVILAGRAEELAQICVSEAQGKLERLKAVVPKVAVRENVSKDALANYLAYRLSLQGLNWWGAAVNLQQQDANPWRAARDVLLNRVPLANLRGLELDLLAQALTDVE